MKEVGKNNLTLLPVLLKKAQTEGGYKFSQN
jgi:hypothetical protein